MKYTIDENKDVELVRIREKDCVGNRYKKAAKGNWKMINTIKPESHIKAALIAIAVGLLFVAGLFSAAVMIAKGLE